MLQDIYLNEWLSIFLVAIALGMDAFSLGMGVGFRGLSNLQIGKISLTIGLLHVLMPLVGMIIGRYLSVRMGEIAVWLGGMLLAILGLHMIWSAFKTMTYPPVLDISGLWGILLFSFSVSLDALSVGFSVGLFDAHVVLTVISFGLAGGMLAFLGLQLGNQTGHWLGKYGEVIGGVILLAFGMKFLLPI